MHPATYFIKYLLTSHLAEDPDIDEDVALAHISSTLRSLGVFKISSGEFGALKSSLCESLPSPFMFHNKKHQKTIDFMRKERISQMWNPNKEEAGIYDFLGKARPRETAQLLLMGNLDFEDIAEKVTAKYRFQDQISPQVIRMLYHYFWNVDIASSAEWHGLLYEDVNNWAYMAALRCGPNNALSKAGFDIEMMPNKAMKTKFTEMCMRVEETRYMPTGEASIILSRLSKDMVSVYDKIYADSDNNEVRDEIAKLGVAHEETNIESIDAIAKNGSHSEGGQDNG